MSDTLKFLALDYLDVTTTDGTIFDGVATELVVTAKDGDGDVDTGYDVVNAAVVVKDGDGNTLDTNISLVALTSGVGTVSDFTVTIPEGTNGPLDIYAELTETEDEVKGITDRDYYPNGWVQKLLGVKTLVFTVEPTAVNRDTNFSMTIQAQDGNGNVLTDATDTITVTLNDADLFDVFTSPTPDAATFDVDLVAGEWSTTTEQVTGGDGVESAASISVSATGFVSDVTPSFPILGAGNVAEVNDVTLPAGIPADEIYTAYDYDDDYIVVADRQDTEIAKISRTDYSVTSIDIADFEELPPAPNPPDINAVIVLGASIYLAASEYAIVKLNLNTLGYVNSIETISAKSANFITDGTSFYHCQESTYAASYNQVPALIDSADLSLGIQITYQGDGIAESGNYFYVYQNNAKVIRRIHKTTFAVSNLDVSSYVSGGSGNQLAISGTAMYFTGDSANRITKIDLTTFTVSSSVQDNTNYDDVKGVIVHDGYGYTISRDYPYSLVKFNLTSLAAITSYDLSSYGSLNDYLMIPDGDYIHVLDKTNSRFLKVYIG